MEHELRKNERFTVDLPIALYLDDLGIMCGRTSDISTGGACVNTGRGILPLRASVEIAITLHSTQCDQHCWRVNGVVVYCHENTTGIRFNQPFPEISQVLQQDIRVVVH